MAVVMAYGYIEVEGRFSYTALSTVMLSPEKLA